MSTPVVTHSGIRPDNALERGRQLAALSRTLRDYEQKAQEENEASAIEFQPNYAAARVDPRTGRTYVPPYVIRPNEQDPRALQATQQSILALRENLARIGYLPMPQGIAPNDPRLYTYDTAMQDAVARFQTDHGLTTVDRTTGNRVADRIVGVGTADAINNFYQNRADALRQTVHSMQHAPIPENGVYVDLTAQRVHVMRNGQSVFTSDVIIGKAEVDAQTGIAKRTPAGALGTIDGITLHPQWNPGTIGARVAEEGRIQTTPGPNNPLGSMRVNMYNRHSVFLHDHAMNAAGLFNSDVRLASLGCIRVKDMQGLARALVDERSIMSRQFPHLARQMPEIAQRDPALAQYLHQHFDPATQRFRSVDGFLWASRQPNRTDPTRWAFDLRDERGQSVIPTQRMSVSAGYRPVQLQPSADGSVIPVFGNNFYNNRRGWSPSYQQPSPQDAAAMAGQYQAPQHGGGHVAQAPATSHHHYHRT